MKIYSGAITIILIASATYAMESSELSEAVNKVKAAEMARYATKTDKRIQEIMAFPFDNKEALDSDIKKDTNGLLHKLYANEKYAPFLELLLKTKKLDPNMKWTRKFVTPEFWIADTQQFTLLTSALFCEAFQNVELLLKAGADLHLQGTDPRNVSSVRMPLQIVLDKKNFAAAEKLLAAGADPQKFSGKHIMDYPLFNAVEKYLKQEKPQEVPMLERIIELMLAKGAMPTFSIGQNSFICDLMINGKHEIVRAHNTLNLVIEYNRRSHNRFSNLEGRLLLCPQ